MSDPDRLIGGSDLGGALLTAARGDAPSRRARERAAAALGMTATALGAALTSGSAAAQAAGGAGPTASAVGASSAAGATAKVASGAAWLKILAGGLVTVAVASGGAVAVQRSRSSTTAPVASVAGPTPGVAPMVSSPTEPPLVSPSSLPDAVKLVEPSGHARAKASRSTFPAPHPLADTAAPTEVGPEGELARELRSIDGARSAFDRGDSAGALAALDRHDRAFPNGSLRTESGVLRTEVLLARGESAAARKLATELLTREPSGPHAHRLRSIAEGGAED